jgi:hypothetical protein
MSVEFRQRTPGEYLNIIRRRKWMIILPISVTSAVSWVVYSFLDVRESVPDRVTAALTASFDHD